MDVVFECFIVNTCLTILPDVSKLTVENEDNMKDSKGNKEFL